MLRVQRGGDKNSATQGRLVREKTGHKWVIDIHFGSVRYKNVN